MSSPLSAMSSTPLSRQVRVPLISLRDEEMSGPGAQPERPRMALTIAIPRMECKTIREAIEDDPRVARRCEQSIGANGFGEQWQRRPSPRRRPRKIREHVRPNAPSRWNCAAFPDEPFDDRAAHQPGRAGHERDLPVEVLRCLTKNAAILRSTGGSSARSKPGGSFSRSPTRPDSPGGKRGEQRAVTTGGEIGQPLARGARLEHAIATEARHQPRVLASRDQAQRHRRCGERRHVEVFPAISVKPTVASAVEASNTAMSRRGTMRFVVFSPSALRFRGGTPSPRPWQRAT